MATAPRIPIITEPGPSGVPLVGPTVDVSKRGKRFLPVYHQIKRATTPYIVNMGGGGSGKSYGTSQWLVKRLFSRKEKLLIIRKFATSLNDSVIAQFREEALPFWGMKEGVDYKYNKTNRTLLTANGSQVLFRGLDNPEKFKSISGVTMVWIEEATEISEKEFMILDDRIRGTPTVILTYNPISERHWLKARFHHPDDPYKRGVNEDVTVIFSTYLDNPLVGEKYVKSMNWYREHNPDHYRVYGLGQFGLIRPENPYFTAYKPTLMLGEPVFDTAYPLVYISADFNIKNSFLVSQHYEGERVNYYEMLHGTSDLEGMCSALADRFKNYRIYFTGDGSGNNGSALTTGNASAWSLIEQHFRAAGAYHLDFASVPTGNPSTASSRHTCNALMAHFGGNLQISRSGCPLLCDDLERMMALNDGSLDKKDCNKHNYGHAGDTMRYDLMHFELNTFERLGLMRKFSRASHQAA
ncbi:PBSX family phage terminase large subunit [Spirosoma sordidisoli]|uniref:PBSX family phage terminase large subunit n=1 Tax=Spirosoma sordidisoli TaxID=2502893 RepID=A0A4Q2UDQ1_9BACT|nr:PBSX family phage terminase large subunit [Spirosoma sordidisoli]RYC66362.1 PBSX family phage terminase large subunit [Spirosoma sordidisoli]